MAGLTVAADRLREADRERAVALGKRLVELDDAMARAEQRAALSRFGVQLQWEAASEALWREPWLQLRRQPQPDPRADPAHLDWLDARLTLLAEKLHAVLRRRRGLGGLRR